MGGGSHHLAEAGVNEKTPKHQTETAPDYRST